MTPPGSSSASKSCARARLSGTSGCCLTPHAARPASAERASRSRTSSSVVWENSWYQRPTASNGSGVIARIGVVDLLLQLLAGFGGLCRDRHDNAGGLLRAQRLDGGVHGGAGGQTVIHEDHGPAANARRWTFPRYRRSRRACCCCSDAATASITCSGMRNPPTTCSLSTRTPPVATAPIASSSSPGLPACARQTRPGARRALGPLHTPRVRHRAGGPARARPGDWRKP